MSAWFCLYEWGERRHPRNVTLNDLPPLGDPCDGCGEEGVLRVTLESGGMLVFCGHCWVKHEARLREEAATVRG